MVPITLNFSYEGQFEQGLRSGLGVYYFTNGRMYEGQWHKGVREGVGVERFESAGASEAEVEAASREPSVSFK